MELYNSAQEEKKCILILVDTNEDWIAISPWRVIFILTALFIFVEEGNNLQLKWLISHFISLVNLKVKSVTFRAHAKQWLKKVKAWEMRGVPPKM